MQGEAQRMQMYKALLDETYTNLKREHSSKSTKVRVDTLTNKSVNNPNLYITGT
jgi:cell division protein FtsL